MAPAPSQSPLSKGLIRRLVVEHNGSHANSNVHINNDNDHLPLTNNHDSDDEDEEEELISLLKDSNKKKKSLTVNWTTRLRTATATEAAKAVISSTCSRCTCISDRGTGTGGQVIRIISEAITGFFNKCPRRTRGIGREQGERRNNNDQSPTPSSSSSPHHPFWPTIILLTAIETMKFMRSILVSTRRRLVGSSSSSSSSSSQPHAQKNDTATNDIEEGRGRFTSHKRQLEHSSKNTNIIQLKTTEVATETATVHLTNGEIRSEPESSSSSWLSPSSAAATGRTKKQETEIALMREIGPPDSPSLLQQPPRQPQKQHQEEEEEEDNMYRRNVPTSDEDDTSSNEVTNEVINIEKKKEEDNTRPTNVESINDQKDIIINNVGLKDYRYSRVVVSSPSSAFVEITFRQQHTAPDVGKNNNENHPDDDSIEKRFKQRRLQETHSTTSNTDDDQVRFYIRIPVHTHSATQEQVRRERLERAERTADFMEVAKSLSLRLSRESWSGRSSSRGSYSTSSRQQQYDQGRNRSSSLSSDCTSSVGDSPVSHRSQIHRRSSAGCGVSPIPRSRQLRRSSIGAMPRRRSSNAFGVTPFSRPPLTRDDSSGSLHRLLQEEMEKKGIPSAPVFCHPMMAPSQQQQQQQQQQLTSSLRSIQSNFNNSQNSVFLAKEALGYEDLDEQPLRDNIGEDERITQTSRSYRRSSMSSVYTSSTTSQYGYEDAGPTPSVDQQKQQQSLFRPNRHHRSQRRGSLVAGSKIERYDDNPNNRKKSRRRSSIQMQMLQG